MSDLVDMPIDTVYMSMDMPCHATLCYACAWLLLSLSPSLSLSLSPSVSSLHLVLFTSSPRPRIPPPCSSILLISSRDFFVPSFPPSHVISPSLSLVLRSLSPSLYFPSRFRQWLSGRQQCRCVGRSTLVVVTVVVGECGGGSRWRTGETRGQGMTVVECSGWRRGDGGAAGGNMAEKRGRREDRACDRDGHMAPESERECLMSFSSRR